MRSRRAGSNDGDMGKGSEVMNGESTTVDDRSQLAICDASADRNRFGLGIKLNLIEMLQRYLLFRTIRDAIERVTGPKSLQVRMGANVLTNIFDGGCHVEILSAVGVVPSPFRAAVGGLLCSGEL